MYNLKILILVSVVIIFIHFLVPRFISDEVQNIFELIESRDTLYNDIINTVPLT